MSKMEIGSPEWCDAAERSEWGWMADVIREARGAVTPHPSYWGPAQRVAEARSIEGWRTKHPAQVPQEKAGSVPQLPQYSVFASKTGDGSGGFTRESVIAQSLPLIAERMARMCAENPFVAHQLCMSRDGGETWEPLPGDHYQHLMPVMSAPARSVYDVHSEAAAGAVDALKALPEDRNAFECPGLSMTFVVQYRSDADRSLWRDHEGGDHVGRFAHKQTARASAAFAEMSRKHGRANVRVVRRFVVDEDVTPA